MKESTKETIKNASIYGGAGLIFLSIIGIIEKIDKKKRNEREKQRAVENDEMRNHNTFINNELNAKSEFSVTDLINSIISNDVITSAVKAMCIEAIKSGRNKLDVNNTKQIYRVANNGFISNSDKEKIIKGICDGHVKTKEELEHDTKTQVAYYDYLKAQEQERTKREEMRIKERESSREQENAIKKTRILTENIKEVISNASKDSKESNNSYFDFLKTQEQEKTKREEMKNKK
jgi:cell division protein FtsB